MFGKYFRQIRSNKKFTQVYVCQEIISRTALSKFENEKNSVTLHTAICLLNKIDMSFDELLYVCNNFKFQEKQLILAKYFSIVDDLSTNQVIKIIHLGDLYLKKQYDQLIFDITVILKNSLKFQTIVPDNDSDNSEILIIWKRLAEMEQWYLIELKLINSILFVLPREIAYNAGLRILKEITKYNDFHYCTDLNLSILKNLSTLFLYYNNYEKCCYISSKLVDLALEKKRYDFLAVGLVRTGFCENDQTKIDKGMEILKITEDKIMFSYLSSELKKFKN